MLITKENLEVFQFKGIAAINSTSTSNSISNTSSTTSSNSTSEEPAHVSYLPLTFAKIEDPVLKTEAIDGFTTKNNSFVVVERL